MTLSVIAGLPAGRQAFLSEAIPTGVAFEHQEIASAKSASQ